MSFSKQKSRNKKIERESEWFSHGKIDRILTERIEGYPIHPDKRKEDNKTVRLFVNKMSSKVEKGMCELDGRSVMSFFAGQKRSVIFQCLKIILLGLTFCMERLRSENSIRFQWFYLWVFGIIWCVAKGVRVDIYLFIYRMYISALNLDYMNNMCYREWQRFLR